MRRDSLPFVVGTIVGLLLFLVAGEAWAVPQSFPAVPAGIERVQMQSGRAALSEERVTIDCDDTLRCTALVRWTLDPGPGPQLAERVAFFFIERGDVESVTVDGVAVDVRRLAQQEGDPRDADVPARVRVAVPLPPSSAPQTIEVAAILSPLAERIGTFSAPAEQHRHPVLVDDREERSLFYGGASPTQGASAVHPAAPRQRSVTVRFSAAWRRAPARGWRTVQRRRNATVVVADGDELGEGGEVWLSLRRGGPLPGGPFVAVGLGMRGKDRWPVLRAGYELFSTPWLVHSLAIETDFRSATVVPATEFASRGLFIIPSVALGAGIPVRVAPRPRAGVRVQAALSWPVFSLVAAVDSLPAAGGEPFALSGTLFGQLSL